MRKSVGAVAVVVVVSMLGGGAAHAATLRGATIRVLSNRADLISGGDALVAIGLPAGVKPSSVRVSVGLRNLTSLFAVRPNGRFEGLVTGLPLGPHALTVKLPGGVRSQIVVNNHPIGGPVIAGPQVQPWVCMNGSKDRQCNKATAFQYEYKSSVSGQFFTYDPHNPPADLATTTTDQGVTVPYIIRVETGYQDRDQYSIAVLYDPTKPWAPWAPQKQFDHKLLITHGASCGIDHQSGTAPDVLNDPALSRGFAVMSTALDNAGHNCSLLTQAESLIMAKERVVEGYGQLRYTIGTGCSGGSLVQQQVANAYPGVYQGILPQCSFPDAWSTGQQLVDYHLIRGYVEHPDRWAPGVVWTPAQIAEVEGHPNHVNSIILDSLYFTATGDPQSSCAGVTTAQRYNPKTNPHGVRCTLADYMINMMGHRPQDGFGGRPLDNVGVQYGLESLKAGTITPEQFVDLNVKAGGADIDANPTAKRTPADPFALRAAYRDGAINETNNLRNVAIIDLRGTDQGEFHDVYRAFAIRARLEKQNGTFANQAIWEGPVPLLGQADFATLGFIAMDRWLARVEKDHRKVALSKKVIQDKPADIHDQCTDGAGQVIPNQQVCQLINPVFRTPRMVAGEDVSTDIEKCHLERLRRSTYEPVEFTDDQWKALQQTFPSGVCDFTDKGVDQRTTIPWVTYQDAYGHVVYGGTPLGSAPRSRTLGPKR